MRYLILALIVVFALRVELRGDLPTAPTAQQILSKFPSRLQLQATVSQYKTGNSTEFASAKADFDLAIRSVLTLDFPEPKPPIGMGIPHVKSQREPLPSMPNRTRLFEDIAMYNDRSDTESAMFFQSHIEEISLDETLALRLVCLDTLLNGWTSWSDWQSERLENARESFPDLHVEYALRRLKLVRSQEEYDLALSVTGVCFELVLDRSRRSGILREARELVGEMASRTRDLDILRFSLDIAMRTSDRGIRLSFLTIAGQVNGALGEAKREFWVPYLEVPDEWIRTKAVSGIVESIRKPRPGEAPRPRDAELAQLLRNVAENDPSPKVRQFLQPRLQYYATSDTRPTHRGGRIGDPPTPIP